MSNSPAKRSIKAIWFVAPIVAILLLVVMRSFLGNQSARAGEKLYAQHCAQCHGANGEGYLKLYPPLAGADYLAKFSETLPCLIRNGAQQPMVVNGVTYRQAMPGNAALSDDNIRSILNYINSSWGNELPPVTYKEVRELLEGCE
ncbi:MAG: cytochrome c [Bacteroidota bacterium]